jgi:DNA processing protein
MEVARSLATGLAEAGCIVVSGLAVGIDAAAHDAALCAGGRTVAVVGCGLDINYPRRNRVLRRRLEAHGTVLSEHPAGVRPAPHNYPARNRIIVGLSSAVVVVEGGMHSGALITARIALDANRLVFAVPGSVRNPMAAGPNELIRRSEAALTTGVKDIFEEIAPAMVWRESDCATSPAPPLEEEEREVLRVLDDTPVALDEICRHVPLSAGRVAMVLSRLEIRSLVLRRGGGYEITAGGARARSGAGG